MGNNGEATAALTVEAAEAEADQRPTSQFGSRASKHSWLTEHCGVNHLRHESPRGVFNCALGVNSISSSTHHTFASSITVTQHGAATTDKMANFRGCSPFLNPPPHHQTPRPPVASRFGPQNLTRAHC